MWSFANRIPKRYHRDHSHHHHGPHDHHHHHDHSVETRKSGTREIKVVRRVLDANDIMANRMRSHFAAHKVFVLNMMSSPGSGKTTTLQKTLARIMPDLRCAVIVGDICTTNDADRLAESGCPGDPDQYRRVRRRLPPGRPCGGKSRGRPGPGCH